MTSEDLKKVFTAKGYKWDPLINVVGIRNAATGRKVTNKFDDRVLVAYFANGSWSLLDYPATTDPGTYYTRKKLLNPKGVAILKEGQYLDKYALRLHGGKYEALCQTYGKVIVHRDGNLDEFYDLEITESGDFGINVHCAGEDSLNVDNASAGCQVLKRKRDFRELMMILREYKKLKKNIFTYTLLNSTDL